ncbi:hypothetical protein [Methylopila turkensis]|uniref:Uncharacterized protein n=1 Tax=Methylopila turkensis TaxID=1437816 RepID=A0A9W6N6E5_9HYPH|nr:hypothetical protein [Methylopila turkensis]GLK80154.1 hypothetical protein GCM10008174_18950 [Methylopila turkensis]
MEGGGVLWLILTVGGVIVLGVALSYGMLRNRQTTRSEKIAAERGAERVYDAESRDPAN